MTRDEFLSEFKTVLEWPDDDFTTTTVLKGNEKWDSVGVLSTMTFIDEELGVEVSTRALQGVTTVGDLMDLVATKLE